MGDDRFISRRRLVSLVGATGVSTGLTVTAGRRSAVDAGQDDGADGADGNSDDGVDDGGDMDAESTPMPAVEGPITDPGDMHVDALARLLPPDVEEAGYTYEEFFVSGTAAGEDYETRLFVVRPADPAEFSGQAIVEPKHPEGMAFIRSFTRRYLFDRGHAAVEVAAFPQTVTGTLQAFDEERYGHLHVTDAQESAIFAQAGRLLKRDGTVLEGVENLYFAGHSFSAGPVWRYMDTHHEVSRLDDGDPIYDGFFPETTRTASRMGPAPAVDVPTIWINSELEVAAVYAEDGIDYRKSDSDEPGEQFRLYEVAGMPHFDARENALLSIECDRPLNEYPYKPVVSVALDHLVSWVTADVSPPRADRIEVEGGPGGEIVRDEHGNAVGGVRNTVVDVPTATHSPYNDGDDYCAFFGSQVPFSTETLVDLYGDHETYVERVDRRLCELVDDGWLLEADADALREEAAAFEGFE